MGRSPCDSGLKKGPWTTEEDDKLMHYIQKHGHGSWRALPKLAGLNRCGKSCRLRWTNYLRPDIKRGKFSQEEEQTILNLHAILGNKWSAIATHLPGRTDNEIKNFWNTHLKKKLIQMGFDPMTHQPRSDIFSSLPSLIALANLKELIDNPPMAQLNQYLQQFLRPPQIFQNNATIQELSASTLWNISPFVSGHLETALPPSSLATENLHDSTVFSRLPGLQGGDGSDITAVLSQMENCASSTTWIHSAATAGLPMQVGDECSYGGGAQIWSELLDDPIFRDIA